MHGIADDAAGVLAQARGLQAGATRLGVGIGVGGQDRVANEVLDEGQGAPTGGVVGVGHAAWPEGTVHDAVLADDGCSDALEDGRLGVHGATLRPISGLP